MTATSSEQGETSDCGGEHNPINNRDAEEPET